MRTATNWYPPFISASLASLVGLTNGASYLISADGTLTLTSPLTGDASAAFKQGNLPNRNVFQLPADASGWSVAVNAINATLVGAAGLALSAYALNFPQPAGVPSAAYFGTSLALATGQTIAAGVQTDASTTTGGSWTAAHAAAFTISWPYFVLALFATTWPSSGGTGVYVQARYV